MNIIKLYLLIAALLGQLLFCTAQKPVSKTEQTDKKPLTPIHIAYSVKDGVVMAGEIGETMGRTDILERNNLNGNFIRTNNVTEITTLLLQEKIDVAFVVPGNLHNIALGNSPYVIVSLLGYGGINALAVTYDSPVKSIAELKGKRVESVMVPTLFTSLIGLYSLEEKDMTAITSFRFPDELVADMQRGKIDAASIWTPWLEYCQDQNIIRTLDGPPYYIFVVMRKEFISQSRESALDFMSALKESIFFTLTNPELGHQWYAEASGIDYNIVRQVEYSAKLYQQYKNISSLDELDLKKNWIEINTQIQSILLADSRFNNFYDKIRDLAEKKARPLELFIKHNYIPDIEEYLMPELLEELAARKKPPQETDNVKVKEPAAMLDDELLSALLKDSQTKKKLQGIEHVVKNKKKSFYPEIIRLLKDTDANVCASAIRAVRRLNIKEAEEKIASLVDDHSPMVRQSAIETAAKINPVRFKQQFLRMLSVPDPQIKRTLIDVFAGFYNKDMDIPAHLLPLINDPDPLVRFNAVRVLTEVFYCRNTAEQAMKYLLTTPVITMTDRQFLFYLTNLPLDEMDLPWQELTKDTAIEWPYIASILIDLGPGKAVPPLLDLLNSNLYKNRIPGIWGMLKLYQKYPDKLKKVATESIIKCLNDSNAMVRRSTLEFLGKLKFPIDVNEIKKKLNDNDPGVRAAAVYATGELQIKEIIHDIVRMLKDEDAVVRENSIRTLVQLGAKESIPEIDKLVNDTDKWVKQMAQWALKQFK